ncbi:MAG: hypothetical protein F6K10_32280 [Moorea sp. SIO2B7]|nr:hypothetical protein [Moorena sp. SIO2B7]
MVIVVVLMVAKEIQPVDTENQPNQIIAELEAKNSAEIALVTVKAIRRRYPLIADSYYSLKG